LPAEATHPLSIAPPRAGGGTDQTASLAVPLFVHGSGTASSPQPVTVGLPFPRGGLQDNDPLSRAGAGGRRLRPPAGPSARPRLRRALRPAP
jgi:hypothetical protein